MRYFPVYSDTPELKKDNQYLSQEKLFDGNHIQTSEVDQHPFITHLRPAPHHTEAPSTVDRCFFDNLRGKHFEVAFKTRSRFVKGLIKLPV